MKKTIVFDTGPIISLATNNLLWILKPLKEKLGGEFYITEKVKEELIDRALSIRRFEFEAMQISQLINDGIIKIVKNKDIKRLSNKLIELANHSFKAKGNWVKIVSLPEIEALAADALFDADATVVDERTTRLLIENSPNLTKLMEFRLHCKVEPNKDNIREFKKILKNIRIIRSTELVTIAYKLGLLNSYLPSNKVAKNPRKRLLNAALWAVKVRGCSISKKEIEQIVRLEA